MLTFFGTSRRSALFLDQAIKNGLKVDLVVSDPPKPVGKKQILMENPTISVANKAGIPTILTLENIKIARYQDNKITIGLILDFNKIIPAEIVNLFSKGIINIHFSKLPRYRGAAPVQYTILNGDKEAWITYYLINEKIDAGQILKQTSLTLDGTENTETLYQKLISKSAGEVNGILSDYLNGKLTPTTPTGVPSITRKLTLENCKIDWSKSPAEIDRLIRAAYPEPGAWTYIELQSLKATKLQRPEKQPSCETLKLCHSETKQKCLKILKAHLEQGKLVIDKVQLESKNPVTYKQFQQGYPNFSLL